MKLQHISSLVDAKRKAGRCPVNDCEAAAIYLTKLLCDVHGWKKDTTWSAVQMLVLRKGLSKTSRHKAKMCALVTQNWRHIQLGQPNVSLVWKRWAGLTLSIASSCETATYMDLCRCLLSFFFSYASVLSMRRCYNLHFVLVINKILIKSTDNSETKTYQLTQSS